MSIREILDKFSGSTFAKFGDNTTLLKRACLIAAVFVIAGAYAVSHHSSGEEVKLEETINVTEETVPDKVYVDIGGEVVNPMVACLEDGSRIEDAIKAAGGLTEDADITGINRAAFVSDGDKVYIPSVAGEGEAAPAGDVAAAASGYNNGKVNINLADAEELQTLTGVGPVTAEKIIEYRESSGRFQNPEDLKNVSGIGDKTYEKLKDSITT